MAVGTRLLLDTSAYSALLRGDPAVGDRVRRSREVLLSSIVAGELLFGFRCGTRFEQNLRVLQDFMARPYVQFVTVSLATADRFARVAERLKKRGRPIPLNDLWIAAHALETGADLLTSDQHFEQVEGLSLILLR